MPTDPWRELLQTLPDEIALARDRGLPIIIDGPVRPAIWRLMDTLGVEVRDVTEISAQKATETRDCAAPSCPRETENGSDYCRLCRTLVANPAQAPRNGGTMTSTVATAVCKIDGCEGDAVDRVGPYARLCATHKQEAREARISAPPTPRPTRTGGASSLSDRARALVPLARAVDRARAKLEELPSVDRARADFAEASRLAQVSPTGENLNRVAEATKLLQGFAPKRTRAEQDVAQVERDLEHGVRAFVTAARRS